MLQQKVAAFTILKSAAHLCSLEYLLHVTLLFITLYQTRDHSPNSKCPKRQAEANILEESHAFCRRLLWLHLPSPVSLHGQDCACYKERRKTKRVVRRVLWVSEGGRGTWSQVNFLCSVKSRIWLKQKNRGTDHVCPALCLRPSWKQVGKY